jgi:hypothetical protein
MRLNALCLIGSLTALAIPIPAGAVPAQSAGTVSAQWGRQAAVTAPPQGKPAAYICPPVIIGNQAAMPHTANLGQRIPRAAGEQRLIPAAPLSLAWPQAF